MAKIRRNISFDEDVWNGLQELGVDVSQYCNSMCEYLLEAMKSQDNTLAELQNQLLDVQTRIHLEHLRIAQKYEDNRELAEENTTKWLEFLEVAEDYSYGINIDREFLGEILEMTGIHESKLFDFCGWINEYTGRDEDQVRNSFSYAFNKYNETTKGSKLYRDSQEIIL